MKESACPVPSATVFAEVVVETVLRMAALPESQGLGFGQALKVDDFLPGRSRRPLLQVVVQC